MICNNCGVEINAEGEFCSNCGQRLDGKISCPNCKKLIDKKAIYCNFCGKRVDGKSLCPKCGKEIDGDFCSHCGTRVTANNKQNFNIFSIISSSLLLFSILLMFGLLFTIGTRSVSIENGQTITDVKNGFSYYLFGVYRGLKDVKFIDLLPNIIATMAIAGSLVVSFIMAIISTIKFAGAMLNKKAVSINSNYLATFICYTFALVSVCMCIGGAVIMENGYSVSYTLSAWTIFGYIASLIIGVASIILDMISKGKKVLSIKEIVKFAIAIVAAILVSVGFFTTYSQNFVISFTSVDMINNGEIGTVLSSFGIKSFAQTIGNLLVLENKWSNFTLSPIYTANYLTSLGLQILLIVTLLFILKNMLNKENRYGVAIALSSLTFVFAITCLVLSIIAKNDLINIFEVLNKAENITEKVIIDVYIKGAIIGLVFSLLVLVSTISCQVVSNIKRQETYNY